MDNAKLYAGGFEELRKEFIACRKRAVDEVKDFIESIQNIDKIKSYFHRFGLGNKLRRLDGRRERRMVGLNDHQGKDDRRDIQDLFANPTPLIPKARAEAVAKDIGDIEERAGNLLLTVFAEQAQLPADFRTLLLRLKTLGVGTSPRTAGAYVGIPLPQPITFGPSGASPRVVWNGAISALGKEMKEEFDNGKPSEGLARVEQSIVACDLLAGLLLKKKTRSQSPLGRKPKFDKVWDANVDRLWRDYCRSKPGAPVSEFVKDMRLEQKVSEVKAALDRVRHRSKPPKPAE